MPASPAILLSAQRVLVIDDDEDVREALLEVLRAEGREVAAAPNGRLGLEVALRWRPDAIALDTRLPDMSRAEVLAALRADPRTASIKVVMLGEP